MYQIVEKRPLSRNITLMQIEAPLVAKKAEPGQFVILRATKDGERIPLTISGTDRERGTVCIIFQIVGATTRQLNTLEEGDSLADFAGPLGKPTELDGMKKVCVVGGGVGCAIAMPIAQKLHENGCEVHSIVGFRNQDFVILEDEFRACSNQYILMTDDGSRGEKGVVTAPLKALIESGEQYDGNHPSLRRSHYRFDEPDNDRRHRNVRRLPPDRRRRDKIRLRGRSRL